MKLTIMLTTKEINVGVDAQAFQQFEMFISDPNRNAFCITDASGVRSCIMKAHIQMFEVRQGE